MRLWPAIAFCLVTAAPSPAQRQPLPDKRQSIHMKGPGGLVGWLKYEKVAGLEDQGSLPVELVIERNGKVVRRLDGRDGGPFFWNFDFLPDGKRVAIQSGPLHFSMQCTLMDIATGRHLQEYDCFHEPLAADAPAWVRTLVESEPLMELTE